MKNYILILAVIFLFSCKKKEEAQPTPVNGTMIFFTSSSLPSKLWDININGKYVGRLKYSSVTPDCGETDYITIDKPPGNYNLYFRKYDATDSTAVEVITIESSKCKHYDYN